MATLMVRPEEQQMESKLVVLKQRLDSIVVRNQDDYRSISAVEMDGKAYIKAVGFELDPGISSAKEHLELLKNQKAKFVDPAKQIVEAAIKKGNDWKAEERRKAEEETRRANEELRIAAEKKAAEERAERERVAAKERKRQEKEAEERRKAGEIGKREEARLAKEANEAEERERKRAEEDAKIAAANVQTVTVLPTLPTVAGKKNQQYFFAEVINEEELICAFANGSRRSFLRQFIQVNQQQVGKYARDTQDNKKVEETIPGVKAWSKG